MRGVRRLFQRGHLASSARVVRAALWIAVPVNLLGVGLFGAAAMGQTVSLLPLAIPPFYAAQLAWIIGLFAGAYFWLASQPSISRPLLLVGGLGKLGFFALFVVYCALGTIPTPAVATAVPDLILGVLFVHGAWSSPPSGD